MFRWVQKQTVLNCFAPYFDYCMKRILFECLILSKCIDIDLIPPMARHVQELNHGRPYRNSSITTTLPLGKVATQTEITRTIS